MQAHARLSPLSVLPRSLPHRPPAHPLACPAASPPLAARPVPWHMAYMLTMAHSHDTHSTPQHTRSLHTSQPTSLHALPCARSAQKSRRCGCTALAELQETEFTGRSDSSARRPRLARPVEPSLPSGGLLTPAAGGELPTCRHGRGRARTRCAATDCARSRRSARRHSAH